MRWYRYKYRIVSLCFFTCLLYCLDACSDSRGEYFVKEIIDGDTIELGDGRHVRYIGIDAPETRKKMGRKWVLSPEPYGAEAKRLNEELVSGRKIRIECDQEKVDKYGRSLAYVFTADDIFVNAELIRAGYALMKTYPPNVKYYDALCEAALDAKRDKRGLWGKFENISSEAVVQKAGKYVTARAYVSNSYVYSGDIVLILGTSGNKPLTGVIFGRNIPLFQNEGIDPYSDFLHREVAITGRVEKGKNIRIMIDSPFYIETLK